MYWSDYAAGSIRSANLDGSNVQDLVTGLSQPLRLELAYGRGRTGTSGYPPSHDRLVHSSYPNPFRGDVSIVLKLSRSQHVCLKIYDLMGRELAELLNERLPSGEHSIDWQANNMSSGVYEYRLTAGIETRSRPIVLVN